MAIRIRQRLVRGEIDNREQGKVRGKIWLVGKDQPIALKLTGNCGRDLAGCLVTFVNPQPAAAEAELDELARTQNGTAGDITASRKVRTFDLPLEEAMAIIRNGGAPAEHLANSLYIEWFSEANGRVVIESADYSVKLSEPIWELPPEAEQEQIESTNQAMLDWLDRLDAASGPEEPAGFDSAAEEPLDEFGYEKVMRESDARTDKYMELLKKYEGHPDREKIVAREMGWEWLEEALEADERGALPPREEMEAPELVPNPATEGVDWIRDKNGRIKHPLSERSFQSSISIWHFCEDLGLLGDNSDADLEEMVFEFQTAGAKIAGALNSLAYDDDDSHRDGGFVVAALKRALNYVHKSIAAAERVAQKKLLPADRLETFRTEQFGIREEMLALMQKYRGKGAQER
ncbi:MAG TPA: hypothetical protein VGM62_12720 [Chthoniobacterales bacterium]|jgi:hypothetical protein